MNMDGKNFNEIMKFCVVVLLIGFAIWKTGNPICLSVLPFLRLSDEE